MFVKVECNDKEYDELVKQLKDEKISYKTETTKQTRVDYFDGPASKNEEKSTQWFYVVRFSIDADNFI